MNEKYLFTLLSIIKNNGDVKRLLRAGLDYKEISEITSQAISEGFIIYESDNVSLSKKGEEIFRELESKLKITDKNKWIEPKNDSRIPVLEKDFIFLPKQDELHF